MSLRHAVIFGFLVLNAWLASTSSAHAAEIRIPVWVLFLPAAPLIWAIPWAIKRAVAADLYFVWYATNGGAKYGPEASDVAEKLSFGTCQVAIPKSHEFGSIGSALRSVLATTFYKDGR
jgi:hypothetical protein